MSRSVAFFGTYLPARLGSRGSSETIAGALSENGYSVSLVSRKSGIFPRVQESIWTAMTTQTDVAVLDVFSSRVHLLSNLISGILSRRRTPIIAVLRGGALIEKYVDIAATLDPVLQRSSRIITPSNYLRAGFEKHGYSVKTVPNALDLSRFPYMERHRANDFVRLLWVRAFADIYRPHWPVEILWHLRTLGIPSSLTMIGPDRGLLGEVKMLAAKLGVSERIDFVGPVPNDKLYGYFHSHDYLLNTTKFESFGVALAESAATGLPIVSASVGEVGLSWTDEVDIFMVPGKSSEEFADRIAELYRVDRAGEKYRRVSRNAKEKVSKFAIEDIVPIWEQMIESVRNARPR